MDRVLLTSLCLACTTFVATAQTAKPPTIVKAGTIEMKAVDERPNTVLILNPATATGDFDTPAAHPACAELAGQEGLDCTAEQVRRLISQKLEEPTLDMEQWGSSVVGINFSINQFGEIKDMKVDHSGDRNLSTNVMIALYDLPRFNAAAKGTAAVNSSIQVNYRYEDLFRK